MNLIFYYLSIILFGITGSSNQILQQADPDPEPFMLPTVLNIFENKLLNI